MKKIIVSILIAILLISECLCITVYAGNTVNFVDSGNESLYQIAEGKTASFVFNVNAAFSSVTIAASSVGNNIGDMRISIYKYDTSWEKTLKGSAIATKLFHNFRRTENLTLSFDTLSGGKYMIHFSDTVEKVGVYFVEGRGNAYGLSFQDGYEVEGTLKGSIDFTGSAQNYFTALTSSLDTSVKVTTPPEYEYSSIENIIKRNAKPSTWYATDGLGRTLQTQEEVGGRNEKIVAMAYWTWHGDFSLTSQARNLATIMAQYPEAQNDWNHAVWKEVSNPAYFWDEPIYGYYTSEDKWVLRRQAELLADAGVDVIFLDNTNSTATWEKGYKALFEAFAQAREDGVNAPCISFTMHFSACQDTVTQLKEIYKNIYRQDKYRELWFYLDGKPCMMAYGTSLNKNDAYEKEIYDFFTWREPLSKVGGNTQTHAGQWCWLETYPQTVYKDESGNKEMVAVGVAINWNQSGITAMNGKNVMGRTWTKDGYDQTEDALLRGAFFAEQWEYAISQDTEMVFVVGWNEWEAGRFENWCGVKNAFPDEFSPEFSRDIEPSTGVLKDYYYYQLCYYIRKFKGVEASEKTSDAKTIDINSGVGQWSDVAPSYYAYQNNTFDRDSRGYVSYYYTNTTGRNDITLAKVARDNDNVYFYVETKDALTSYTDNAFMRLFIDTGDSENAWEGFEYIVNRVSPDATHATLERATSKNWEWETIGKVEYNITGNVLQIKIPKSMLGITEEKFTLNFKWADNTQNDGDIMDFYVNGDVAPGGRFMYHYDTEESGISIDPISTTSPKQKPTTKKQLNLVPIIAIPLGCLLLVFVALLVVILVKKRKG